MKAHSLPAQSALFGGRALTVLTLGRVALVPLVALTFMAAPAVTTVALLAFMFADLYDGVLARRLGVDGPRRRAVDSAVDRVAIDACLVAAAVTGAMPVLLVCAFLLRDLYCAAICAGMMREREVAIKADLVYRGLNCLLAAWAMAAPLLSASGRLGTALVLFAASLLVAADLTRSVRLVRRAPALVENRVVSATRLRSRQVDWEAAIQRPSVAGRAPCRSAVPAAAAA